LIPHQDPKSPFSRGTRFDALWLVLQASFPFPSFSPFMIAGATSLFFALGLQSFCFWFALKIG